MWGEGEINRGHPTGDKRPCVTVCQPADGHRMDTSENKGLGEGGRDDSELEVNITEKIRGGHPKPSPKQTAMPPELPGSPWSHTRHRQQNDGSQPNVRVNKDSKQGPQDAIEDE